MIVLVCGCRDWENESLIEAKLASILTRPEATGMLVIHGGARGADSIAGNWASLHGVTVRVFKADWSKYEHAAGPIRNQEMLDQGRPDLCIAFWDGRSKGTLDMIKRATAAGVPVEIVPAPR